jgi:hypothetical protein
MVKFGDATSMKVKNHRVSAHASMSGAVTALTVSHHKGTTVWNSALWP